MTAQVLFITRDCGCRVTVNGDDHEWRYCPTHEAAPAMLALLRRLRPTVAFVEETLTDAFGLVEDIDAVLEAVEGKEEGADG